jgi:protocatechuate 3,4-dioxygenase beta subunit
MIKKLLGAVILGVGVAMSAIAVNRRVDSGLKIGDFVSAFHPNHVTGPHKGTDTCPPCTYGKLPAVQVWVNGDDSKNVEAIARLLDRKVGNWNKSEFKAFMIFVTDESKKADTAKKIEEVAGKSGAKIAMAWIGKDNEAVESYAINVDPAVKNTVLVYKDMKVSSKFVNLVADEKGMKELALAIDKITK